MFCSQEHEGLGQSLEDGSQENECFRLKFKVKRKSNPKNHRRDQTDPSIEATAHFAVGKCSRRDGTRRVVPVRFYCNVIQRRVTGEEGPLTE